MFSLRISFVDNKAINFVSNTFFLFQDFLITLVIFYLPYLIGLFQKKKQIGGIEDIMYLVLIT